MQVKKRVFPYPVINHNLALSNYGDKSFLLLFEQEQNDNTFVLKNARFETGSQYISDLYDRGDINVYCVIECSDTVYRKSVKVYKEGHDIVLSKIDFSERVDVSMFAVAARDFIYDSDEYDDDYKGAYIEIEKNDIVGANDGFRLIFSHEEDEDSFAHSIFSIITSHDMAPGAYTVECSTGRKIVITLADDDFDNYKTIYAVPVYTEVFFNMILIPSLIEGLSLCQLYLRELDSRDLDDACNQYIWFRSVVSAYKRLKGIELTTEEFKRLSMAMFAQELLGKPLGSALDKLVKETNSAIVEGGEDE